MYTYYLKEDTSLIPQKKIRTLYYIFLMSSNVMSYALFPFYYYTFCKSLCLMPPDDLHETSFFSNKVICDLSLSRPQ